MDLSATKFLKKTKGAVRTPNCFYGLEANGPRNLRSLSLEELRISRLE